MTDYEHVTEIRDAITAATDRLDALATVAEQLEELASLTERVDALGDTLGRIAVALEQLVKQHDAASLAAHGSAYYRALHES